MSFFGKDSPAALPLPNKDGSIAYPESRLVRDWLYQSCTVSNISHLANVEADTTKPDPMGEDLSAALSRLAEGDDYTSFTYDPAKSVWGMNTNAVRMTFPGNRVLEIPWSPWDNPSGPATTNIPGMPPVSLTGFIPNVAEPRKQKRWDVIVRCRVR